MLLFSQRGLPQLYNIVHWESQSMASQHAKFSTENRNLPSHCKAYLCVSVIRASFSLYFLHTGCFYNLIICPHECTAEKEEQICIHIYIHLYTQACTLFRKQFQETRYVSTASQLWACTRCKNDFLCSDT